jgi:hypothetical protein
MRYLKRQREKIENKSKDKSLSTLSTDIDAPFWLSHDMISKSKIKMQHRVLFPFTKYGVFPQTVIEQIVDKNILFSFFDERDILRILLNNFFFCDTSDHHLFIKKSFEKDLERQYKSVIISKFYEEIKFIIDRNEEFKKLIESLILTFFYKTNLNFFNIIENKINDLMCSVDFENWIQKCKLTIEKYISTSKLCSKQFGEVFSPDWLIKEMLSILPKADKNMIFLDPAAGIGNFTILLVEKLMNDLKEEILDEEDRKKHILENMIVQCEIQIKNSFVNYFIIDPEKKYDLKIFTGSFLTSDLKKINPNFLKKCKEWGIKKFDYAIGNPPYHIEDGGGKGSSAKPIYNIFFEKLLTISDNVLLITPSRWFNGGKGLGKFRQMMLKRTDILYIKHFENAKDVFDIELPGGVSYIFIDKSYNGQTEFEMINSDGTIYKSKKNLSDNEILITNEIHFSILKKIFDKNNIFFDQKVLPRNPFLIANKWSEEGLKTLTKDGWKFVNESLVSDRFNVLEKYKLVISKADGAAFKSKKVISKYSILDVNEASSETYLICYSSDVKKECENVGEYLMLKPVRFLLYLKLSGQNNSREKFSYIPVLDFTKVWSEEDFYNHFDINDEERNYINNFIK